MDPPKPSRRRLIRWIAGVALALVALLVAAAVAFVPSDDAIRRRIERTLAQRFDADVALAELHVSVFPRIRVAGAGLRLTPRDRANAPPLVAIARFSATAGWQDLFRRPRHVGDVALEGLRVTIAPRDDDTGARDKEAGGCRAERRSRDASNAIRTGTSPVFIERLSAPDAEVVLLPREAGKLPRRFAISSLRVRRITLDEPLEFEAVLTNPTPRGIIATTGRFGPWVARDPGLSPVEGHYVFEHADLGTIGGLGGTLASKGRFGGVLQQILVSGTSDTPDFSLDTAGHGMPLHAEFDACVDGTDGDTYLDRVDARLASSPIQANGKVEGRVGVDGRTVSLDVKVDGGRIEDFLRLAVRSDPPLMTGAVSLAHSLLLPPGPDSVVERLQLNGQFRLEQARFTGRSVQQKIDALSRRGQGRPDDRAVNDVASNFAGRFTLAGGTLQLPQLSFETPGARVQLHGRYGLVSERISFAGTARLKAKPSEMTSGIRSTLLKIADPLLGRKDAGTVVPIEIAGTREHPDFRVDVKGVLLRRAK